MKCKFCNTKFKQTQLNQKSCRLNDDCKLKESMAYIEKQRVLKEKKQRKETAEKKKDLMTLSDWLKIAQATFNHFIRLRDDGLNCISCQKPPKKKNAGHYFNANNHYSVRFDEDNVHLQCEYCNTSLSGNLIPYRKYLIRKIGISRFAILESIAYQTRKFTIEEVKNINEFYKKEIKILQNQNN